MKQEIIMSIVGSFAVVFSFFAGRLYYKNSTVVFPPGQISEQKNIGAASSIFTRDEIGKHDRVDDCWVIISNKAYSLLSRNSSEMSSLCGQDLTENYTVQTVADNTISGQTVSASFEGIVKGGDPQTSSIHSGPSQMTPSRARIPSASPVFPSQPVRPEREYDD